jgi:hypothetical protein
MAVICPTNSNDFSPAKASKLAIKITATAITNTVNNFFIVQPPYSLLKSLSQNSELQDTNTLLSLHHIYFTLTLGLNCTISKANTSPYLNYNKHLDHHICMGWRVKEGEFPYFLLSSRKEMHYKTNISIPSFDKEYRNLAAKL